MIDAHQNVTQVTFNSKTVIQDWILDFKYGQEEHFRYGISQNIDKHVQGISKPCHTIMLCLCCADPLGP